MKRLIYTTVLFSLVLIARGQGSLKSPVEWQYTAKKIAEKTYEVHITAALKSGWHAYSQQQPEEAVAQPTLIHFTNNPLVGLMGKVKEIGSLEKWKDEASGISANQYKNTVDFVQIVKIKGNAKVNLSGSLTYQVCTDEMCMPPKTDNFSIPLGI